MKKTKKKKIFIIIIFLIIILIILNIILGIVKYNMKLANDQEHINGDTEENDSYKYPYKAYTLFIKYNGESTTNDIVESLYNVATEVIPKYFKNFKNCSNDEIEKYYNENTETIKKEIGIKDKETFLNLILEIQKLSGNNLKFDSYRIDEESVIEFDSSINSFLYITYEGNEEFEVNIDVNNFVDKNESIVTYSIF